MKYLLLLLLTISINATAVVFDTWICIKTTSSDWDNPKVTLQKYTESIGSIHVGGELYTSNYNNKGFIRRWDWGSKDNDKSYAFAFTIDIDGKGKYFDFSAKKTTTPSMFFRCKKIKDSI